MNGGSMIVVFTMELPGTEIHVPAQLTIADGSAILKSKQRDEAVFSPNEVEQIAQTAFKLGRSAV
jgi:hypothetical protein